MSASGNTANSLCGRVAGPIPTAQLSTRGGLSTTRTDLGDPGDPGVIQENPPRISGSHVAALGGRFAAAGAGGRGRDVGWN
ncbi:hypothetical protein P3T29_001037 [Kitasatospora sp. MAP5-34]|nr:hypothetical protein [Kitasatospora sp. MAP5-34]